MTRALLIDGGQSGCRVALARDGVIGAVETAPGLARVGRAYGELRELVARHEVDVVAAGLTGYAGEDLAFDAPRVLITNDAVTAHLGALGGAPGAVIVAGTGAIALAAGSDGTWARVDGWGTMLGDDGGGYWIGRRALALALRAHDGRGGCAELRRRAEARYGPLANIARAVYDALDPVAAVAAFTRDVADAARAGDEAAGAIWDEAGRELARTTAAALGAAFGRDAGEAAGAARSAPLTARPAPGAVAVSWSGGLFAAGDLLLDPFRAELARLWPAAEARAPLGGGLEGAARLAEGPTLFASLVHECGAP